MSSEEDNDSDGNPRVKAALPMPAHKVRFSDMPQEHQEIAIRCKLLYDKLFLIYIWIFKVCAKCNIGNKFDKDVAKAITAGLNIDPKLMDDCAGWHVIVGKSFASAITYNTKCVIFFDLLGEVHKTYLLFKT